MSDSISNNSQSNSSKGIFITPKIHYYEKLSAKFLEENIASSPKSVKKTNNSEINNNNGNSLSTSSTTTKPTAAAAAIEAGNPSPNNNDNKDNTRELSIDPNTIQNNNTKEENERQALLTATEASPRKPRTDAKKKK